MSQEMSSFARNVMNQRYAIHDGETWSEIAHRVATNVMGSLGAKPVLVREVEALIRERKFIPGGRYLYASGRPVHQVQNCLLMRAEDTREGWGELTSNAIRASMTGAGIGVNYSAVRPYGSPLARAGGIASGPIPLMQAVNELGRCGWSGGKRRGAIWAGLSWRHDDVFSFVRSKDWSDIVKQGKAADFNFPGHLDFTNISVCLDDEFFLAYHDRAHPLHDHAVSVYWTTVRRMLETGEPGFSIDCGKNAGEDLRNACTEVTASDDSDICNLGSINLARIGTVSEMKRAVELGTLFLLAGSVYSDVPYAKVARVREKNRRLGLGLMGIHEWLLTHGKSYGPSNALKPYLDEYVRATEHAHRWAGSYGLSKPVKTRAIAPNGTIGIVAETTTGLEPIFAVAYKRRYRNGNDHMAEYVVDPTAHRLVQSGVSPDAIEDAMTLARDPERRLLTQAWLQRHVDHGISSTINMPAWGSEHNNEGTVHRFGTTLLKYLPLLRGITVFPDGARGAGQPLNAVPYREAVGRTGEAFVENSVDVCELRNGGQGGGCG